MFRGSTGHDAGLNGVQVPRDHINQQSVSARLVPYSASWHTAKYRRIQEISGGTKALL